MIKELKPHVAEYVQQLVGGNSNLESKLQALLPGVFADTGAAGKTDRRLNDLAIAVDEKQGRGVLLIETLGSDGLRYWSYAGGQLKPDDIFSVYKELKSEDECEAWLVFHRYMPEIIKVPVNQLEDYWVGDERWDLNVFDSRVYGEIHESIFRCSVHKHIKKPGYARDSFDLIATFDVPDWLRDYVLGSSARQRALESGAAD